jgi:PiT family inorganic phosphate transporter
MGIITLALVASGKISSHHFHVPLWVVFAAATAISLGTFSGGWRIIKTLGSRLVAIDPAQGFIAQTAGAAVILAASHGGYPLSTTHVISGGITGAGAGKRLSAVRWGVAREIVTAWVLTLPCAAAMAAVVYGIVSVFGRGDAGPLILSAAMLLALAAALSRSWAAGRKNQPSIEAQ